MKQFDSSSVQSVTESHADAALQGIRIQIDRMRGIANEFCCGEWLELVTEQLDSLDHDAAFSMKHVTECIVKGHRHQ